MAEGNGTDAGLLAELNDLLRLDHDAVQAYTLAIQNLPRDAFGETLARFRDDHERHVAELSELVRSRGGAPAPTPRPGWPRRCWSGCRGGWPTRWRPPGAGWRRRWTRCGRTARAEPARVHL